MLTRLMKYELRATARTFLPLYGALLVLTIMNRIFFTVGEYLRDSSTILSLTSGFGMMLYVGVMVAIMVTTVVVAISRFYKNLLGDEGYVMFTLPVTVHQQILSKLIISFLWMVVSGVLAMISIFMLVASPSDIITIFRGIWEPISYVVSHYGFNGFLWFVELLILGVIVTSNEILKFYMSIAVGQAVAPKNKILGGVGIYLGMSFAMQIAFTVLMMISRLTGGWHLLERFGGWIGGNEILAIHLMMLILLAVNGAVTALYYWLTSDSLKKRLNLA